MKNKTTINITLSDTQQKNFDDWCLHLKALYGEVGLLTWKITSNGIGDTIIVYSHDAKVELDLTEVENW